MQVSGEKYLEALRQMSPEEAETLRPYADFFLDGHGDDYLFYASWLAAADRIWEHQMMGAETDSEFSGEVSNAAAALASQLFRDVADLDSLPAWLRAKVVGS